MRLFTHRYLLPACMGICSLFAGHGNHYLGHGLSPAHRQTYVMPPSKPDNGNGRYSHVRYDLCKTAPLGFRSVRPAVVMQMRSSLCKLPAAKMSLLA
jgi:hypothetical protein